jgi:hypothetical protein
MIDRTATMNKKKGENGKSTGTGGDVESKIRSLLRVHQSFK